MYRTAVDDARDKTRSFEERYGFRSRFVYGAALKGFASSLNDRQLAAIEADPAVAFVSPDRPVSAFGTVPLATGDSAPAGVRRVEAATTSATHEASSANVAVIDTGIDLDHPDLNAVHGRNCVGSGLADDDDGHGTHVAGTIGAKNNGSGVTGIAPGTRLYAAKVLDHNGDGTTSQIICAVDWATRTLADADASNDIRVANMSLGGLGGPLATCSTTTDPLHQAICKSTAAGITYVVAAGNESSAFDDPLLPVVPAAYPEVLTVTAMTDSDGEPGGLGGAPACNPLEQDDHLASFSNFAATSAGSARTMAAPGTCVVSTWMGGRYATSSGTSMAAPHAAGGVALCLGEAGAAGPCSDLTPAQIVQKMRSDAAGKTTADAAYGFTGDATLPGPYYGYLEWVGMPAALVTKSAAPDRVTIQKGSHRSGRVRRLAKDDNRYFKVNSTKSRTYRNAWYGTFGGVSNSLRTLTIVYKGKSSRRCRQTVWLYRFSTRSWVRLDARTVGRREVRIVESPGGRLANYVSRTSGNGSVHVRIACATKKARFYTSGDLLRINYSTP